MNRIFKAAQSKDIVRLNLWSPNDKSNSYFHFLKNKAETPQQGFLSVIHQTIFLNLIPCEYHLGHSVPLAGSALLEHMLATSHPQALLCCCFSLKFPSAHSPALNAHLHTSFFVASPPTSSAVIRCVFYILTAPCFYLPFSVLLGFHLVL